MFSSLSSSSLSLPFLYFLFSLFLSLILLFSLSLNLCIMYSSQCIIDCCLAASFQAQRAWVSHFYPWHLWLRVSQISEIHIQLSKLVCQHGGQIVIDYGHWLTRSLLKDLKLSVAVSVNECGCACRCKCVVVWGGIWVSWVAFGICYIHYKHQIWSDLFQSHAEEKQHPL